MRKKHFTEEQIAFAMRQAESGTSVAEIIRKLGISAQAFYRWKKRFAGLGIAELRRLRTLEEEAPDLGSHPSDGLGGIEHPGPLPGGERRPREIDVDLVPGTDTRSDRPPPISCMAATPRINDRAGGRAARRKRLRPAYRCSRRQRPRRTPTADSNSGKSRRPSEPP